MNFNKGGMKQGLFGEVADNVFVGTKQSHHITRKEKVEGACLRSKKNRKKKCHQKTKKQRQEIATHLAHMSAKTPKGTNDTHANSYA